MNSTASAFLGHKLLIYRKYELFLDVKLQHRNEFHWLLGNILAACIIFSKFFEIYLSENLSVNAQEIPRFLVEPSDTNVVEFENTEISCSATGVPVPTIVSWMKDGVHIVLDGTKSILTSGALRITNARKSDDGYYQCVARNVLASVMSRRAKLNVACKFIESRVGKFSAIYLCS